MIDQAQFKTYQQHLMARYQELMEKSGSYRFLDECVSDVAAFKAMKIRRKLNQMSYLNRELFNTLS